MQIQFRASSPAAKPVVELCCGRKAYRLPADSHGLSGAFQCLLHSRTFLKGQKSPGNALPEAARPVSQRAILPVKKYVPMARGWCLPEPNPWNLRYKQDAGRSEERRVGKEGGSKCSSRWMP